MDSARNGHNWIRNFIACDSPIHTHRRTYSHTGFFNSVSLCRLEAPWSCFSLRDFSAFGFGKTLCAFSRRKLRKLLLALHGTSPNEGRVCVCVCLASLVLNALYFLTLTTPFSLFLSVFLSLFFLMKRMKVSHKETEKIVFWLRCALLLDSFALSL